MGSLFLAAAAFLCIAAAVCSFFSAGRRVSRILFIAAVAAQAAALCLLLRAFISHDFLIEYVRRNCSLDTPLLYRIAGVWAGQEGSFLLWTFLTGLCCFPFVFSREKIPFSIAAIIAAAFASAAFVCANPFVLSHQMSADGMGLKLVLRNPWMAIHPPVLFFGYALCVLPFVRALDALLRRELSALAASYREVLLIVAVLGAGIVLGGIWAYETLGWGGFWGWDPVENSSLVPWLAAVSLVHVLLLHKRQGHWDRASYFLSVSLFILVLFSAFLTRSGILSSVSVHSFGASALSLPLGSMSCLSALAAGLVVMIRGRKLFPPSRKQEGFREIVAGTGVTVLIFYSFIILAATMAPLAMLSVGRAPVTVKISFFNNITLVFSALFLGAIAVAVPVRIARLTAKVRFAIAAGSSLVFILVFLRLTPFSPWIHFSVILSGIVFSQGILRLCTSRNVGVIASVCAHAGFALFVAGCISFSLLSHGERKEIAEGDSADISGGKVAFNGIRENGGKGFFLLDLSHNGKTVKTEIPYEKLADGSLMSVSPAISHGFFEDRYLFVEGYLSRAELEKIVKDEKIEAKTADTVLVNVSKKKMLLPILLGAILIITGACAGFIAGRKK